MEPTPRATDEPGFTEDMLPDDPLTQFAAWMADVVAAPLPEPTAMVLATVSASGRPRARTVLLKSYDSAGFVFYTNRTSRKGTDLAEVPRACLLFPWHPMQRQVIIEGTVSALSTERERALLPVPPARLAARRLGQPAVDGGRLAGRTR